MRQPKRYFVLSIAKRSPNLHYSGLITFTLAKKRAERDLGAVFEYGKQGAIYVPPRTAARVLGATA